MSANADKRVKLRCRNVWKVYGANPEAYFAGGSGDVGDTPGTVDRLRAEGAIPAAANVSIDVNEGEIFVIMGLSGSGKSSLAFDTIYAEGQRRYVESLSAYARQFL